MEFLPPQQDSDILLAVLNAAARDPSFQGPAIEGVTSSGQDDATRDVLLTAMKEHPDVTIRCVILRRLLELWPDTKTHDFLIDAIHSDVSADVRALSGELLARLWWTKAAVRALLRSRAIADPADDVRDQLRLASTRATAKVSNFWERKLLGDRRQEEDEPEMLPGYPAFRIVQFRLRDIGPVRDSGVVTLSKQINIFLGDNASGKTTLLRSIGLAAIGQAAANEVEEKAISYLRKGTEIGNIEVLLQVVPDPDAGEDECGYFATGLRITAGSSRFSSIPDSEMSLFRPGYSLRPLPNSAEALGAIRSISQSQFGFVAGYGAVARRAVASAINRSPMVSRSPSSAGDKPRFAK
jgi:hypothetical protein